MLGGGGRGIAQTDKNNSGVTVDIFLTPLLRVVGSIGGGGDSSDIDKGGQVVLPKKRRLSAKVGVREIVESK